MKGRGPPNLMVKADKQEVHDAGLRARFLSRKGSLAHAIPALRPSRRGAGDRDRTKPVDAHLLGLARTDPAQAQSKNPTCVAKTEPLRRHAQAQSPHLCVLAIRLEVLPSIPAHDA